MHNTWLCFCIVGFQMLFRYFKIKTVNIFSYAVDGSWMVVTEILHYINIFTVAKCILILSQFIIYQLIHNFSLKRSIKIYIKTAPTRFGLIIIIRERTIRAG
jgi:hypothetical protein